MKDCDPVGWALGELPGVRWFFIGLLAGVFTGGALRVAFPDMPSALIAATAAAVIAATMLGRAILWRRRRNRRPAGPPP